MKRSYSIKKGDAILLLDKQEKESVDMILTDPPYSSGGLHKSVTSGSTGRKYSQIVGDKALPNFLGDNKDQWSFYCWCHHWLSYSFEALKDNGSCVVFIDWRQLTVMMTALQSAGFTTRGIAVWNKRNARPIPNGMRQTAEFIIWATKGDKRKSDSPVYLPGVFDISSVSPSKRQHQTQKPDELMDQLVSLCEEGGVVLDPFSGSGSTGVAALKSGRQFIGYEMSEMYVDVLKKRLSSASRALGKHK